MIPSILMALDNDPFPPSLPTIEEPRIFDENMSDAIEEGGLDMTLDSPTYFWNEATSSGVKRSSDLTDPIMVAHQFSQSPQSSSSSESSNRHKRNHSSDSSRSGQLSRDGNMRMAASNSVLVGTHLVERWQNSKPSPAADVDSSNRAMECHFDFDSAASSPTPYSDTKPTFNPAMRPINMPFRSSLNAASNYRHGHFTAAPNSSRETSPLASMIHNSGRWRPTTTHKADPSTDLSKNYIDGAILGGTSGTQDWPSAQMAEVSYPSTSNFPSMYQTPLPYTSAAQTPLYPPTLHVHPLPAKSRVETQIPIKLTLYHAPLGISKLHLQTYTISKSKLVAKPSPERTPDMLELQAMLVCTSAMQDLARRGRAFARAARFHDELANRVHRLSSDDTMVSEDDDNKPLNGGPVHICGGCIERERKRAARKKTKNIDEEELWLRDEDKRTIVFNTQEVKEWQQPSLPRSGETTSMIGDGNDIVFPENALQVDLPMRIACYCRHQEEKVGFQVIFTIKDFQDNMIAQTMTNSIIITDDHKTHASPGMLTPQTAIFPENSQLSGGGVFSHAQAGDRGLPSFRHAYSTTDLQGMQQQFSTQRISPFAIPNISSQAGSTALTPKALSRQASPTSSGQQKKKRKASGSARMRNDLTMTKLQTSVPPSTTGGAAINLGISTDAVPAFAPNFAPQQISSQLNTTPQTPSTTDGSLFSSAQRSQSMENLQGFSGAFSVPNSVRASRVPSPTLGPQSTVHPQTHAQILTSSLHSIPGMSQPQRSPVIHKLTPGECSKSGGIEVTCLGSGFYQGLEVMFGDAQATTTTFWGESALVCLVPPALHAGTVKVTFKHNYEQNHPSPPNRQTLFRYNDDDEQELIKHALALIDRKINGSATDAAQSARNIISRYGTTSSFISKSNQGSSHQRQASTSCDNLTEVRDLETGLLSCLDLVDLDDSPYQAGLNARGSNGQSMLHLSASLGYYRLAAALLARGANPDLRDNNGMSPMHMASLYSHLRIVRKLRSAGGDQTLRSLNGYTPADMATSRQVRDASNAFDHHVRSMSMETTSIARLSRASSVLSTQSSREALPRIKSTGFSNDVLGNRERIDVDGSEAYGTQPTTPARIVAASRRNSASTAQKYCNDHSQSELTPSASVLAANPAMTAWKDQISAQIQLLQQSVHWTLPNLQIPTLPPIPNLPDYQAHPVVRRISSLVPQRSSRPTSGNEGLSSVKEADYRWWELLTGPASSPPAYEEIFPVDKQFGSTDEKAPTLRAVGEAFMDRKCEVRFDQVQSPAPIGRVHDEVPDITQEQRDQLRTAHAMKVKRLQNDRNLFFIWIPLLVLVLVAMLKDRGPQILGSARQAFHFAQNCLNGRLADGA